MASPNSLSSQSNKMISLSQLTSPHVLLLISLFTLECLTANSATCHKDDMAGLLAFKAGITDDPTGLLASWKSGTDCCQWSQISCGENKRVNTIQIYGQADNPKSYLTGTLSPSLSKLRYLNGLYLFDLKNISGNNLFTVLLTLPDIQYVYISNSKLSGKIPSNISSLTKLYALGIDNSRLSGPIPCSISKLTELHQLRLGGNLLNGTIPKEIGELKNLTLLHLDQNQLTGAIPEMFSMMTELRTFNLSHNKLSGKIPLTISSLAPKLIYLDLGYNSLTGQIPSYFGKFHTLDTLALSSNRLSGIVPKTFANLTKIFNLDLSHNLLVDPFPQLNVKGIESLDLSYNNFHLGSIPKWVTTSPIIYSLKLAKCGLKLKLDDWKPSQTYFYDYIDLSNNNISGSPVKLLNQTNYLKEFSISSNKVRFDMATLKFSNTLRKLDLSRNLVFGKLPNTIAGLKKLNVSYNHLCGSIPATSFPESAFVGNDCLCGFPLAPCKK